ncbi:MAG: hypothetical protein JWO53_691 [Chlamydiia bacterium]|nr:hypothetical protein [Chlamydiia bacterium]
MNSISSNSISIFGQSAEIFQLFAPNKPVVIKRYREQGETITLLIIKTLENIKNEVCRREREAQYQESPKTLENVKMQSLYCYFETLKCDWLDLESTIRIVEQNSNPYVNELSSSANRIMATLYRINSAIFFILEDKGGFRAINHCVAAFSTLYSKHGFATALQFIEHIPKNNAEELCIQLPVLVYIKCGLDAVLDYIEKLHPTQLIYVHFSSLLYKISLVGHDQEAGIVLSLIKRYLRENPAHSATLAHLAKKVLKNNTKLAIQIAALIPSQKTAIEWFTENQIFSFLINVRATTDIQGVKKRITFALECCADTRHDAKELISYAIENLIKPTLRIQKARLLASLIPDETIRKAAEEEILINYSQKTTK